MGAVDYIENQALLQMSQHPLRNNKPTQYLRYGKLIFEIGQISYMVYCGMWKPCLITY